MCGLVSPAMVAFWALCGAEGWRSFLILGLGVLGSDWASLFERIFFSLFLLEIQAIKLLGA